MIKGFIRLGIAVALLTWIGAAVFQWRHVESDKWLIEGHVSLYLRGPMSALPPTDTFWPAYAANPSFLALSERERVKVASNFYERKVRPLEELYFVGHADTFKNWFISTARLDVNEAPVRHFDGVAYRQFDIPRIWIAPRISYVLFGENVLLLTAIIFGAVMILIIASTLAVRWIYYGFVKT